MYESLRLFGQGSAAQSSGGDGKPHEHEPLPLCTEDAICKERLGSVGRSPVPTVHSLDFHAPGYIIQVTDGRKARLAQARQMNGEELAEIYPASFFLYDPQRFLFHVRDLHDETFAVDVAELRERGEGLFATDDADRKPIRIALLRGREWKCEEGVLIVLLENDDGPRELAALAVELIADVLAKAHPPDLTFTIEGPRILVGSVGGFLNDIPVVELVLHSRASRA